MLRRIAANLQGKGLGALAGAAVKQATTDRVFGFKIMPAPFMVAHPQVGLTLQSLDTPLTDDPTFPSTFRQTQGPATGNGSPTERPGIFLTNALTGWEPRTTKPLPFPELEDDRDRTEWVKQATPILVILDNPPYNGFAGVAVDEEREVAPICPTLRNAISAASTQTSKTCSTTSSPRCTIRPTHAANAGALRVEWLRLRSPAGLLWGPRTARWLRFTLPCPPRRTGEHDRHRLRLDRGLGSLRDRRYSDARPRPSQRTSLHPRTNTPPSKGRPSDRPYTDPPHSTSV